MNLIFKKIRLKNFFSFEDETFIFDDFGFTLVKGQNKNTLDNAISNGSGKSTIFNGICFALTGETAQGINSGVENIYGDPNDCYVELDFSIDKDIFKIIRYKTPKPDLKIIINGEDRSGKGIRDSSKLLSTYIPDINKEMIGGIIILGQGLPQRFSNNNPAGRKEILEKLTKSDFMIQSIKDLLERRKSELEYILRTQEDTLLKTNSELNSYSKMLKNYYNSLDEYNSIDFNSELSLRKTIKTLGDEIKLNREKKSKIEEELSIINNKLLEKIDLNQKEYNNKIEEINSSLLGLSGDIHSNEFEIKSTNSTIKNYESMNGVCPTCGQKLPDNMIINVDQYKDKLSELKQRKQELKRREKELTDNKIKLLEDSDVSKTNITNEYKIKSDNLSSELNSINDYIFRLNDEFVNTNNKLTNIVNKKNHYDNILSYVKEAESKIKELNSTIDITNKSINDSKKHIRVVMDLISIAKREFRGVLLTSIIEYINKRVQYYSKKVFNHSNLSFKLNDNYIDVTYCDRLYENLSGGEKTKCDIIIQLALRDLLSDIINIRSNIIVFDEVFDALDSIGCEKIINLLFNELKDISSVYIITHRLDLPISNDNTITVIKDENGLSHIIK